ncbi:glycosyltransferase [Chryseobacterium luquanense]|uniref:Glycosyltransferase n=1 Tax=Chryseobacterium luquanense TaxID=2983766 RepID=A0ABT3Y049_9FLAO|nr:glycosyltransferase [Chryseobacterium luquanense]MCX8531519.1 glycosyltransferase [Chryseobacterium luquanense]
MKVLMINSVSGYGSTGSICVDIALELERQRHECYIAYGQVSRGYGKEFKIGNWLENHLHNIGSRLLGKQGYFTHRGTKKLVQFIENYNPDVIHLHNLHGNYLNLEIIFKYLKEIQKPIVWTLHDCWAFTGNCAYYSTVNCEKWQTACNNCPQIHAYPPSLFLDQTNIMFNDKIELYRYIKNMTIVAVSNWLKGEVEKSILKDKKIMSIYNWIDHDVFKESILQGNLYGINKNKHVILGVSAGWNASSIKFQDFIKLSQMLSDDMQLVLVGKLDRGTSIPSNIIHIPYVESKSELAKLYTIADTYVHLSMEDTFGLVIAEAMSCGTPVVVYDSTACPEIVGENCGYTANPRDVEDVYNKIKLIKKAGKDFYRNSCRQHVIENYDKNSNINSIINVYKSVMNYDY